MPQPKTIEEILEELSQKQWELGNKGLIPLTKNVNEANQAMREAIERVRPPYPDRAKQPEVYHQLKDKVDEWNEAIDAVLKELGLDDDRESRKGDE